MSVLTHRSNTIFDGSTPSRVSLGSGSVVVLPPGGIASASSSGDTITLYSGHGFSSGDKFMVGTDVGTFSGLYTVTVSGNSLTSDPTGAAFNIGTGDRIINLGTDTGTSTPNFDGSTVTIYSTPDTTTEIEDSTIIASGEGFYEYWHAGLSLWELILDGSGEPVGYEIEAGAGNDLPLDLDSDGENELTPNANPFTGNDYLIYLTKTYDASLSTATSGRVQSGIKAIQTWTGDSTAASTNREGIFAINRFGSSGDGGATVSGPSIATGGYSEHYGDGTWAASNGAFLGGEFASTLYGPTDMDGVMFGSLSIASVDNATIGGTATAGEFVGARGLARTLSGTATITTAVGVDGVVTQGAAGTITDAIGGRFQTTKTGAGIFTNAYGARIEAITQGTTNNYGLWIGGASGGATTNEALYVATGRTTFADTTAYHIIKSNNSYFGDGTDRDINLNFDTSTSDGAITYKGGSATNVFEFNKAVRQVTANTAIFSVAQASEELTLSTGGATTDTSANLLPAGAFILGVVARVTTTIATATDWALGDATTALRFCTAQSGAQLTAGATVVGMAHLSGAISTLATGPSQAAAAPVRVTTTGTPSAGAIRITVFYLSFTAPTS